LILFLLQATWVRFVVWVILGLVVYFAYSMKHSALHGTHSSSTNRWAQLADEKELQEADAAAAKPSQPAESPQKEEDDDGDSSQVKTAHDDSWK
jgi:hypothetical protein